MSLPLIVVAGMTNADKVYWFLIGLGYLVVGNKIIKNNKNRKLNDKNFEKQIHENYLETAT